MLPDLLGFVLKTEEPDAQRRLADEVQRDPRLRAAADNLKHYLEVLRCDLELDTPSADLVSSTYGAIADYAVNVENYRAPGTDSPLGSLHIPSLDQREPFSLANLEWTSLPGEGSDPPLLVETDLEIDVGAALDKPEPAAEADAGPPGWAMLPWRNVLAAVVLGLSVVGIALPMVLAARRQEKLTSCQQGLRNLHIALEGYADKEGGKYPEVQPGEPAAKFVLALADKGLLKEGALPSCPAHDREASDLRRTAHDKPASVAFAYTLGYRDESGKVVGVRREPDNELLPIACDTPGGDGDSPSMPLIHGGGANVLYRAGHVRFVTASTVGIDRDDILVNQNQQVKAGVKKFDAVLGRGDKGP